MLAILDYMRNVRWTYQRVWPSFPYLSKCFVGSNKWNLANRCILMSPYQRPHAHDNRPFCESTTAGQQIDINGVIEIESLLVTAYKGLCPWVSIVTCLPHIPHVIQNSWQSLWDLCHSGNYILECLDHISMWFLQWICWSSRKHWCTNEITVTRLIVKSLENRFWTPICCL